MSAPRALWENYRTIYNVLVNWLRQLVGHPEASAITRRAMSTLARLSWNGYQTQEGPFAELVSLCLADMASHGLLGAQGALTAVPGPSQIPDEEGIRILVALYAASYLACYEGQWSMQEREVIFQHLRAYDPGKISSDLDDPLDAAPMDVRVLLRRAFSDVERWFVRDILADQVALSVCDDELIRSLFWLRQFSG